MKFILFTVYDRTLIITDQIKRNVCFDCEPNNKRLPKNINNHVAYIHNALNATILQ